MVHAAGSKIESSWARVRARRPRPDGLQNRGGLKKVISRRFSKPSNPIAETGWFVSLVSTAMAEIQKRFFVFLFSGDDSDSVIVLRGDWRERERETERGGKKMKKKKKTKILLYEIKGISGGLSHAVGVSSRSEFLNAAIGTNVFSDVTKGSFVMDSTTTTTTGLLFPTFRLH